MENKEMCKYCGNFFEENELYELLCHECIVKKNNFLYTTRNLNTEERKNLIIEFINKSNQLIEQEIIMQRLLGNEIKNTKEDTLYSGLILSFLFITYKIINEMNM